MNWIFSESIRSMEEDRSGFFMMIDRMHLNPGRLPTWQHSLLASIKPVREVPSYKSSQVVSGP